LDELAKVTVLLRLISKASESKHVRWSPVDEVTVLDNLFNSILGVLLTLELVKTFLGEE
jgi:hypothetical protein